MEKEGLVASQRAFGNLCEDMKSEQVEKLKAEHQKVHSSCLEKIEQWEKFKKDYEALQNRLETLPARISYDIMVPFGSLAFMPGQLIHTNEVMALLGSNWFAEVSANHAAEISKRRIEQCENMLKDLKKEKEQSENWLNYINEITGGDLIEIREPYCEEEENQWREQHSKNVKAYRMRKAKMKDLQPEEKCEDVPKRKDEAPDKDYFQILEVLEQQERLGDEINEWNTSELDDDDDDNDDDLSESSDGSTEEKKAEEDDSSDEHLKSNGKHVKWKDQEGEKMKNRITFTHSSRKSKSRSSSKPIAINKTKMKSKESAPLSPVKIQSPSDIYKCFSTKPENSKPKSILKRRTSVDDGDGLTESENEYIKFTEDLVPVSKPSFKKQTAFTGEIVEHEMSADSLTENTESATQRPPSHFKARRQNKTR